MTAEQQINQIYQMLAGGNALYQPPQTAGMGPGNQLYRAVPNPGSAMDTVRGMLGPAIGQAFLGMQNPVPLAHIAPGMSVQESIYATNVTARQWALTQQQALYQISQGVGGDFARIGERLGMPQTLGMSTSDFRKMISQGASTPASQALMGAMMNNTGVQQLMGGNPLAAYQTMFSNRNLFGIAGGELIDPYDANQQDRVRRITSDMSAAIVSASRNGLLPNYNFTRGFGEEKQAQFVTMMQQSGGFGNLVPQLEKAGEGTQEYSDIISKFQQRVGSMNKMFEALNDLTGAGGDVTQLAASINKLTQGEWPRMDQDKLRRSLREMEAVAQMFDVSKQDMLQTVTMMQGTVQGALGVTANQAASGMAGGGFASLPVANNLSALVYSIASATGRQSPADIARISQQQAGLAARGLQSRAGQMATFIEYAGQEGMIDQDLYNRARTAYSMGSVAEKSIIAEEVLRRSFGSEAEGRRAIDDPYFRRMMQERMSPDSAQRTLDTIMQGQRYEYQTRFMQQMRGRVQRGSKAMQRAGSLEFAADPNAVAEEQMKTIETSLREDSYGAAADTMREAYQRAIDAGKSPADALRIAKTQLKLVAPAAAKRATERATDVKTQLDSASLLVASDQRRYDELLGEYQKTMPLEEAQRKAAAGASRTGMTQETQTILGTLRTFAAGDPRLGADKDFNERMIAITKMSQKDPYGALQAAVELGNDPRLSEAQRRVIGERRTQLMTKELPDKYGAEKGAMQAWTMTKAGVESGMSPQAMQEQNKQLGDALKDLRVGLSSSDPVVQQAARDKFQRTIADFTASGGGILDAGGYGDLLKLGAEGNAGQVAAMMDVVGRTDLSMIQQNAATVRGMGVEVDTTLALADRDKGLDTYGAARSQMFGRAVVADQMASMNQGVRATLMQSALAYTEGRGSLAAVLGIREGGTQIADPALRKRVEAFGKRVGLDAYNKKIDKSLGRVDKANKAYTELLKGANMSPQMKGQLEDARSRLLKGMQTGAITDEKQYAVFKQSLSGLPPEALAQLDEMYAGGMEFRGAAAEFTKRVDAEDTDKTLAKDVEMNQRAAARQERIQSEEAWKTLGSVEHGTEGTGFIGDMNRKDMSWSERREFDRNNAAIAKAVQEPRTGKQIAKDVLKANWYAITFRPYKAVNQLLKGDEKSAEENARIAAGAFQSDAQLKQLEKTDPKMFKTAVEQAKLHKRVTDKADEKESGKGKGGRRDRLEISGRLTLVDSSGRPRVVNVEDGQGAFN